MSALRLSRKYSGLLTAIIMTIALDSAITFTMISIYTGWPPGFLQRFVNGWLIGFVVALPISLLVIPLARRIVNRIVSE